VNTQAVPNLEYVGTDAEVLEPAPKASLLRRLAEMFARRRRAEAQFVWNAPPPKQLADVVPSTVYCVDLPVSNPMRVLDMYVHTGVTPDHVVFVGDPLTINDDDYYSITRKGALVHETAKSGRRQRAQKELSPYFEPAGEHTRPSSNPNPYTYNPGPPKVTPEQLQALIDAIGRRRT